MINTDKRASQGLVKDSPTFKNFSSTAMHYLTAMGCSFMLAIKLVIYRELNV